MPTITAQIGAVTPRQVTSRKNGQTYTFYDLQTADGQKFDVPRDMSAEAYRLLGQVAQITFDVVQNGDFTNLRVQDIQPTGNGGYHDAPVNPGLPAALPSYAPLPVDPVTYQPQAPLAPPAPAGGFQAPPMEGQGTAKDLSIWRQTATKVAALTSNSAGEFWSNVEGLIHFYRTGERPNVQQDFQPGPSPDDDIPF